MQKQQVNGTNKKIPSKTRTLDALYAKALPSKRTGHLYNAFPYPTKISPEAIALFIATHTKPGDTVFDGFAGSGTTGLAALLCENPPEELREEARRLDLNVKWGARNAVLYELGALGAFVGQTLTNPPEPKAFRKAAEEILVASEEADAWMYCAKKPDGGDGSALSHKLRSRKTGWQGPVIRRRHSPFSKHRMMQFEGLYNRVAG